MKFFLCLDDTDDISSIGTGALVEMVKKGIHDEGLGICHHITRHQLFISPEIPYTSHNSAMCLEGEAPKSSLEKIEKIALDIVKAYAAEASDPGFCMVVNPTEQAKQLLIQFGKRATQEVLTKDNAYDLATYLGITLSEHGGTGQGVIGALAGVGLRISGNHGEAKGILKKIENLKISSKALKEKYKIEQIETICGNQVDDMADICIYDATKVVLKNHRFTLLVKPGLRYFLAINKKVIRELQMGPGFEEIEDLSNWMKLYEAKMDDKYTESQNCPYFIKDMEEECIDNKRGVCYNCQFRRWESDGFKCLKQ